MLILLQQEKQDQVHIFKDTYFESYQIYKLTTMYRVEHKDIDSQKFMNAKNIFFLNSRKSMFAKTTTTKKIKDKNFNSLYLFQTSNLVKQVQILKRFSQELSS